MKTWMPQEFDGEWLVVSTDPDDTIRGCLCREDAETIARQLNDMERADEYVRNYHYAGHA